MADFYGKLPDGAEMVAQDDHSAETTQIMVGTEQIKKAMDILRKYKAGKEVLEQNVVENEKWYRLQHWDYLRRRQTADSSVVAPSSAWMFNTILNKHADAMDNFPEPIVLPREQTDTDSAKVLSEILPVVMEQVEFEKVYSDAWWDKLKHGTAIYGITWDASKENGLGDVSIRDIDLLNVFWEPGISDIQKSRNLFIVDLIDTDLLKEKYPDKASDFGSTDFNVKQYMTDDNIDNSDKSLVVDWYYKVDDGWKTVVHFVKFCGNAVLYATENDPQYRQRGLYDHGMYPVVFDTLFPEQGSPAGFGYVAICKDPQMYIDRLSGNILESSMMGTKKRYFMSESANVNEDEFRDWTKPIVHVNGEVSDVRLREIPISPVDGIYFSVLQAKIEEMKDTAANRDVNSGGTGSGVTSGAAIAALQEAGNKASRDYISASYRAYAQIIKQVIELIRQYYDIPRAFRITGQAGVDGQYQFVDFDNSAITNQQTGIGADGNPLFRKPIFDLKIKAQKKNPYSRMEQNEIAKELYAMGVFAPDNAQPALMMLDMMDFEGIEDVKGKVAQGQTLANMVQQMQQELMMMKQMLGISAGAGDPAMAGGQQGGLGGANLQAPNDRPMDSSVPQDAYTQNLVGKTRSSEPR